MTRDPRFQPVDAAVTPRFAGIATFMRTQRHDISPDIDVALVGVVLATVLVAVVLALAGLGSLTGVTVFGGLLVAAIIVFLFVLAVAFAAQATVGLALGRLLLRGEGRSFLSGLGALALGLLVVVLVGAIPVAGGFLEALLVLLGLGALLLMARPGRRGDPQPSLEAAQGLS